MKASELIKLIKKKCGDEDLDIEFMAYSWSDNLEEKDYFEAWFNNIKKKKNTLKIFIDT